VAEPLLDAILRLAPPITVDAVMEYRSVVAFTDDGAVVVLPPPKIAIPSENGGKFGGKFCDNQNGLKIRGMVTLPLQAG
jgi:hypothetical protein